ncbi:hypothetical protein PG995_014322 [Apiospora arundinis]
MDAAANQADLDSWSYLRPVAGRHLGSSLNVLNVLPLSTLRSPTPTYAHM